jgi:hypothetical protein
VLENSFPKKGPEFRAVGLEKDRKKPNRIISQSKASWYLCFVEQFSGGRSVLENSLFGVGEQFFGAGEQFVRCWGTVGFSKMGFYKGSGGAFFSCTVLLKTL